VLPQEPSIIDEVSQERSEEWPLQRFQRLFPERISARLISHARGRRAHECSLCHAILETYHRLLRESGEVQGAEAPQPQAAPAAMLGLHPPQQLAAADATLADEDAADAADDGFGSPGEEGLPFLANVAGFPLALQSVGSSGGGAGGSDGVGSGHQVVVSAAAGGAGSAADAAGGDEDGDVANDEEEGIAGEDDDSEEDESAGDGEDMMDASP